MNTFIAIVETYGANSDGYPASFPWVCEEYLDETAARAARPDALIMAISDYPAYVDSQSALITAPPGVIKRAIDFLSGLFS